MGTSHEKTLTPCQDSVFCEVFELPLLGEQLLAAIVADGAGSASRAEDGSAFACQSFNELVSSHVSEGTVERLFTTDFPITWLCSFRDGIRQIAESEGLSPREYACTAVATLIRNDTASFFQIGDGAIVLSSPGDPLYGLMFWPDRGEYENVTQFATQCDAEAHLQISTGEVVCIDEVAIFSDGLQRLALNYRDRSAHTPFFTPLFEVLRRSPDGECVPTSEALSSFLGSARVNSRTDDDKSLIIATRRLTATLPETQDLEQ